jgi:hypothetical protein
MTRAEEIDLGGLVDVHIHTSPDSRARYGSDLRIAREAVGAAMRAVLIKSHWTLTADRAAIAEEAVDGAGPGGTRILGGLALNGTVGWLNPLAVETALAFGARQIWMPTLDLAGPSPTRWPGGPVVVDGEGRIRESAAQIVGMIIDAGVTLGTGHLSPVESAALVRHALDRGARRILVTHPEASFIGMDVDQQLELRSEGVFFERCFNDVNPIGHEGLPLQELAAQIRAVGVESTVLSTDYGQAGHPAPTEGLRQYLSGLLDLGFSWVELRRMAAENPAYLMGLS